MKTYPIAYSLPPPDGIWYECAKSHYGPRMRTLKAGWIDSVPNTRDFNPCKHSSFDGCLTYLGSNSMFGPTWRKGAANTGASSNALTLSGWYGLTGIPLRWQAGKACTAGDPYMRNRRGELVRVSIKTSDSYCYTGAWSTPATLVNATVASTAPAGSMCMEPGSWFCKDVATGKYPADLRSNSLFHYYTISRPTPSQIEIDWTLEYHTKDSYTKLDLASPFEHSTGIEYALQFSNRKMSYTITHIMGTTQGTFRVRVIRSDINRWYGWQPWNYYEGSNLTKVTQELTLATMEPGTVSAMNIQFETSGLNLYAEKAPVACEQVYSKGYAKIARSNAVSNVDALDSNWIENVSQAGSTLDVVSPLLEGWKAVQSGSLEKARRALVGAYLVYLYSVKPGIADYQNINKDGQRVFNSATATRFANERRRGSFQKKGPIASYTATQEYHCTLHFVLKSNPFAQLWNALEKLGLDPSASNLWDLVPYSFVVDWFTSIGSILGKISDYNSSVITKDLKARIESYKVSWPMPFADLYSCLGLSLTEIAAGGSDVTYKWYRRDIFNTIGSFDPFAGQSNDGPSASQWTQGAALVTNYL